MVEVVSCAHYTVKEYLYSQRIRSSSAAYFALGHREAALEFATSGFTQALNFRIPPTPYRWLDSAQAYAVAACGLLTRQYSDNPSLARTLRPDWIIGDEGLFCLICRFLDPSRPHYKSLACLRDVRLGDVTGHFTSMAVEILQWEPPLSRPGIDSAILANLLIGGMKQMAEEFIKDKDVKELCVTHHTVQIFTPAWSRASEWRLKSCCGTIPVILASTLASPDCFEWFLECAGRDIDATSMLVNLIRPPDFAVTVIGFNRLLKLGADPNADGYALTPLQLAAWAEITKQLRRSLTMVPTAMQKGRKGGRQWPSSRKIFRTCVPSTF
jgi:hypothetical protein